MSIVPLGLGARRGVLLDDKREVLNDTTLFTAIGSICKVLLYHLSFSIELMVEFCNLHFSLRDMISSSFFVEEGQGVTAIAEHGSSCSIGVLVVSRSKQIGLQPVELYCKD